MQEPEAGRRWAAVDEPTEQAWWYRRDDEGDQRRDEHAGLPPANRAPSLPTPSRAPSPPDQDSIPHPGLAAPGRHGWARAEGTYVPSMTDRGATKSIVLGALGLLICGVILGPS